MNGLRLALRLYAAAPAGSAVVGILVVLVSGLLVAGPRAAADAAGVELRQSLADVQGSQRDIVAQATAQIVPGSGSAPGLDPAAAEVYGALDDQLRSLADTAAPDLRARLGEIDFVARGRVVGAKHPDRPDDVPTGFARFAFDPRILDRVEVVEGRAPTQPAGPLAFVENPLTGFLYEYEIMMSADAAATLVWDVGQPRIVEGMSSRVTLVGTFRARDPDAAVWQHVPSALTAEVFDDGNTTPTATATAFVAPETLALLPELATGSQITVWMPFDATGLSIDEAQQTRTDLRRFTNAREPIDALAGTSLRFSSATLTALERVLARSDVPARASIGSRAFVKRRRSVRVC